MNPKRIALLACLTAAGLLGVAEVPATPAAKPFTAAVSGSRHSGSAPSHGGGIHRSQPGSHRPGSGTHWNGGHWNGSRSHSHFRWGFAFGVPFALGWYNPWYWGPGYYSYSPYAYGPAYRSYGYACEQDEDCWRERQSRSEPAPATTEAVPPVPGEEGGPTQRPLHLNYCDSAKAWYPQVRTCPGEWRLIRPDYNPAP